MSPMLSRLVLLFTAFGLFAVAGRVHAADVPVAAPGKLVIVKAFYGDLPDGAKTDVTEKVAGMVKEDKLSVDATNDNFGDPADGIVKKLKVEYTIDGVARSKTVDENENLTISGKSSRLVIVKAVYGDLPDGNKSDVTEKVTEKISNDSLTIDATNDNFGDPADGVVKKLKVDYTVGWRGI